MSYQDERLYERQWETGFAEDCEHSSPACADCSGRNGDDMSTLLCPKGHRNLLFISGDFPTGVSMDGYQETRMESGFFCEKCNQVFDPSDIDEDFGSCEYHDEDEPLNADGECPKCEFLRARAAAYWRLLYDAEPHYTDEEIRDCYSDPTERAKRDFLLGRSSELRSPRELEIEREK